MSRAATASELQMLLSKRSMDLRRELGEPRATLSLPLDRADRIRAEVPESGRTGVVVLHFRLGDEDVDVPVELTADYEEFVPL